MSKTTPQNRHAAAHTVKPLWTIRATAPNGTEVFLVKYTAHKEELTWGGIGLADAPHANTVWKAKLAAARGDRAIAIVLLEQCGYRVEVSE